jgi:hypothetical protein
LKKRTKLGLSLSVVAGVAGIIATNISAHADTTHFVLISNKQNGSTHHTHIAEYNQSGVVQHSADPGQGAYYYVIDATNPVYIQLSKKGRTIRIPASGYITSSNIDQFLPACLRVSNSGSLHPVTDSCNTSGPHQGSW